MPAERDLLALDVDAHADECDELPDACVLHRVKDVPSRDRQEAGRSLGRLVEDERHDIVPTVERLRDERATGGPVAPNTASRTSVR